MASDPNAPRSRRALLAAAAGGAAAMAASAAMPLTAAAAPTRTTSSEETDNATALTDLDHHDVCGSGAEPADRLQGEDRQHRSRRVVGSTGDETNINTEFTGFTGSTAGPRPPHRIWRSHWRVG